MLQLMEAILILKNTKSSYKSSCGIHVSAFRSMSSCNTLNLVEEEQIHLAIKFKYYLKALIDMRRIFKFGAIGGVSAATALILIFVVFAIPTKDFAIDIDPMKDNQNLFSTSRVMVANIGKMPLTNIAVNYGGGGNNAIEKIASLSPGEKVLLSPPSNSPLKSVTVTTDQGLSITKDYRTPIKLPGMMGS
jgi:hypothetical protein